MRFVVMLIVLFVISGCVGLGDYMERRNGRGCYQGRLTAATAGIGSFIGDGLLMTGDMTAEECIKIREALTGG